MYCRVNIIVLHLYFKPRLELISSIDFDFCLLLKYLRNTISRFKAIEINFQSLYADRRFNDLGESPFLSFWEKSQSFVRIGHKI